MIMYMNILRNKEQYNTVALLRITIYASCSNQQFVTATAGAVILKYKQYVAPHVEKEIISFSNGSQLVEKYISGSCQVSL